MTVSWDNGTQSHYRPSRGRDGFWPVLLIALLIIAAGLLMQARGL